MRTETAVTARSGAGCEEPLRAELVAPAKNVIVVQVEAGTDEDGVRQVMHVARATAEGEAWRVRAMAGGHEELVASPAGAIADLLRDLHEAFPTSVVDVVDLLCESCRRDAGVVRAALGEETFRVCASCVLDEHTRQAVA